MIFYCGGLKHVLDLCIQQQSTDIIFCCLCILLKTKDHSGGEASEEESLQREPRFILGGGSGLSAANTLNNWGLQPAGAFTTNNFNVENPRQLNQLSSAGCSNGFPVMLLLQSLRWLGCQTPNRAAPWAVAGAVGSFFTSAVVCPGSGWIDSEWTSFPVPSQPFLCGESLNGCCCLFSGSNCKPSLLRVLFLWGPALINGMRSVWKMSRMLHLATADDAGTSRRTGKPCCLLWGSSYATCLYQLLGVALHLMQDYLFC